MLDLEKVNYLNLYVLFNKLPLAFLVFSQFNYNLEI
jgi:hypothetical protein